MNIVNYLELFNSIENIDNEIHMLYLKIDDYNKTKKYANYINNYVDMSYSRAGQDVRYALDDSKLQKLGWKPNKVFDCELTEIVKYYKNKFVW